MYDSISKIIMHELRLWKDNISTLILIVSDSSVRCQPLVPIPFGHVLYEAVDSTVLQPGDMVMYKCDAPYMLKGDPYRVCVTNGSWTGEEPSCTGKRAKQHSTLCS